MIRCITLTSTPTVLHAGIGSTPFGMAVIAMESNAIYLLAFVDSAADANDVLRHECPHAMIRWDLSTTQSMLDAIVHAPDDAANFTLALHGSPFQIDVWHALTRIPRGQTLSYQQLAASAGHPKAIRATASAIGRNRIAMLIPCHRVIHHNGKLGHFRWSTHRKQALIQSEIPQPSR